MRDLLCCRYALPSASPGHGRSCVCAQYISGWQACALFDPSSKLLVCHLNMPARLAMAPCPCRWQGERAGPSLTTLALWPS